MKKTWFFACLILIILTSCEKNSIVSDETLFIKDNGIGYRFSDFEIYDSSTHIFYFRNSHPEFLTEKVSKFSLMAYGNEIYSGIFRPPYSSSLPVGPYIDSYMSLYQDYAFRVNFMSVDNKPEDLRNHPVIIQAMKDHNLLHSGLALVINSVERIGTQLILKFTVTNNDINNLLIIDPEKTGPALFHYFTNGLYLRDLSNNEVFSEGISPQTPDPWDSWNINWLSQLKAGESKQCTINYTVKSILIPGEYRASFQFPGLEFQISEEQLYRPEGRIWLGNIEAAKKILIQ
jgi:hypothetical protein